MAKFTEKRALFVAEYLKDFNASFAARRAGYPERGSNAAGYQLLRDPDVAEAIREAVAERMKRTEITTDAILGHLWGIATADTNDIVEHRRGACRHCYGTDHRYQRTAAEMERDVVEHQRLEALALTVQGAKEPLPFDEQGGVGYEARRDPAPECPECEGEGLSIVFVKDTRTLSPGARALYAGVKQTKDGVEIKMHAKDKALELLGKHLGLFRDKLEVTGADGKGLVLNVVSGVPAEGTDLV